MQLYLPMLEIISILGLFLKTRYPHGVILLTGVKVRIVNLYFVKDDILIVSSNLYRETKPNQSRG